MNVSRVDVLAIFAEAQTLGRAHEERRRFARVLVERESWAISLRYHYWVRSRAIPRSRVRSAIAPMSVDRVSCPACGEPAERRPGVAYLVHVGRFGRPKCGGSRR